MEYNKEFIRKICLAMWEADEKHKTSGGGTMDYIEECLLPTLEEHGLEINEK